MWKMFGVCLECNYVASSKDMVVDPVHKRQGLGESAATPMPSMSIGLAKAGSLAKSMSTTAKSSAPKLAGEMPKLSAAGSSFAEMLIRQVAAGRDPHEVIESLEGDIERSVSDVSDSGSPVRPGLLRPGMHVGIRGPKHNGYHTVDTVAGGVVTMKGEDGHMESIPLSDLSDHEVVHSHIVV
jgi:hypothetical protein